MKSPAPRDPSPRFSTVQSSGSFATEVDFEFLLKGRDDATAELSLLLTDWNKKCGAHTKGFHLTLQVTVTLSVHAASFESFVAILWHRHRAAKAEECKMSADGGFGAATHARSALFALVTRDITRPRT